MTTIVEERARRRVKLKVNGLVQGVGFRPFVYRVAKRLGLGGFVGNTATGVTIEVEGSPHAVQEFARQLHQDVPELALINSCLTTELDPTGQAEFGIVTSSHDAKVSTLISPDIATCDDCLKELFAPSDRRYRYSFINCTNCGPRYTIVESLPYDRPFTSMKSFPMCSACEREYHDPSDRRFHAQPNACPACGPKLTLHDGCSTVGTPDPIKAVATALKEGQIVAMRGIGGFHLAVDATNDSAVRELRRRKRREEKPLAIMAPDVETIRKFCEISFEEERLLRDFRRPIVLLDQQRSCAIAHSVALGNRFFGVMLPYTPLHHLLIREGFQALVMTSGNLSEEPIAIGNEEALERLSGIADLFLLHDREILQRNDDSIVRLSAGAKRIIRRSRGFVPLPVCLPQPTQVSILACGADLKNTIALTRSDHAFLSQHIGDLDNPAALSFFEKTIGKMQQLTEIRPELITHDLHPEYLSTKYALKQSELPRIAVQHHHAHLASVMVDNRVSEPTLGIILDGTGYGTDGTIWGGELLLGDFLQFERLAWLEPIPMPGGTAAINNPWRMALSYLYHVYQGRFRRWDLPPLSKAPPEMQELILQAIDRRINCPVTSSCGRMFDAIASLLDICHEVTYEAQAAVGLEMAAMGAARRRHATGELKTSAGKLGALPIESLIEKIVDSVRRARATEEIALEFHRDFASVWLSVAKAARDKTGVNRVALSGGVYQNNLFLELMVNGLRCEDFEVLTHHQVPTNDGGLALGQVVIADAMCRDELLPGRNS